MPDFDFERYIIDIPDYPKPGVLFKDIMPLLGNAEAFSTAVNAIAEHYEGQGVTKVIGAEARGFVFGAPVAYRMGAGFVPARKPGKLPRETYAQDYEDEYATNCLEIHTDALTPDDKVIIVDDLIATGGTAVACAQLIERAGAKLVGYGFLMELAFFKPREVLAQHSDADVFTLVKVQ